MNNEIVTMYVSIHYGYDNKERLYITGGTTTSIYCPRPKVEQIKTGEDVNTYI